MEFKIKKKTIKIIALIVMVIVLIIGLFVLAQYIMINNEIKKTEDKLSKINAEELEQNLIDELKKTDLNIYKEDYSRLVETIFTTDEEFEGYIVATITFYKNRYVGGQVQIPCFKIDSDKDGNFKRIEYSSSKLFDYKEPIMYRTISKVFKEKYDVDMIYSGNNIFENNYDKKFTKYGYGSKNYVLIYNEDFYATIYKLLNDEDIIVNDEGKIFDSDKTYNVDKFGLNIY